MSGPQWLVERFPVQAGSRQGASLEVGGIPELVMQGVLREAGLQSSENSSLLAVGGLES